MSLAAKFPLKSTTFRNPSAEHQEVRITFPDGSTSHQKMVKENVIPEKNRFLINDYIRREEDIISSQSSSESFVLQPSEDIRSSSGSNSDAEGGWNLSKNVDVSERTAAFQQYQFHIRGNSNPNMKPLIGHQRLEKAPYRQADVSSTDSCSFLSGVQPYQTSVLPTINSWPNMSLGMESSEADVLASLLKTSTSTFASQDSDITNGTGVECVHDYVGHSAESGFTVSKDGRPKFQPLSVNHGVQNSCHGLQADSLDESHKRNGQYFIKQRGFPIDPKRPSESFGKQQSGNAWKSNEIICSIFGVPLYVQMIDT